jgi:hypothetical protein
VRIHLDAGRDAEPDGLRPAPAVRQPCESLDIVRAVDDEASDARLKRPGDLVVRLGVSVQFHTRRGEPRLPCSLELAERGDARIDTLACDDRPHPDEGAGLHRIGDPHGPVAKERVDVLAQARPDGLGVVDIERRSVCVGQRREIVRADLDVPVAANGRAQRPDRGFDHEVRSSVAGRRAAIR